MDKFRYVAALLEPGLYGQCTKLKEVMEFLDRIPKIISSFENEWQPIDTAPKDGSDILAISDDLEIVTIWWNDDNNENDDKGCWSNSFYGMGIEETKFTHWMPLPEPPK